MPSQGPGHSSAEPAAAASSSRRLTRRRLLALAAGGVGAAAAGGVAAYRLTADAEETLVAPSSQAVIDAERARPTTGRTVNRHITATPATVDIGGQTVDTWTYDGVLPGRELRARVGDRLRVTLSNRLPAETSIHWHGLELRNDMDGAPGAAGPAVAPGGAFTYEFAVPHPGTYFFHPHVGVQLDRGLYTPLIVDDPDEPGDYDAEAVLVLDDWTDGLGRSPEQVLADLRAGGMAGMGGMGGMGHDSMPGMGGAGSGGAGSGAGMGAGGAGPLGVDTGDVAYPAYLVNGSRPEAPHTVAARPGQRIRLRMINAGADTVFRFGVGGHRLTVTHADGRAVRPVAVDTLLIGMGERYDAVVTAGSGAFPIVAAPEGKGGVAMAVLRTEAGSPPDPAVRPAELGGRLLSYRDLVPADGDALPVREPDRVLRLDLGADPMEYRWTINGRVFDHTSDLRVRQGERVRLAFRNTTAMNHPMHVHGHAFAVRAPTSGGARKDTVIVLPNETVEVDLQADNPGQWMVHCHNAYHQEAGMMTVLSYVAN
jgi:FtsP/CotA-like multicopper oxidase with cupredoxin domain